MNPSLKDTAAVSNDKIEILLEQQPYRVPVGCTLSALVLQLGHTEQAVSTALNGQFIPRSRRAEYRLKAADRVVVFQAIVGG